MCTHPTGMYKAGRKSRHANTRKRQGNKKQQANQEENCLKKSQIIKSNA